MTAYSHMEIQRIVRLRIAGWHPQSIATHTSRTRKAIDRLLCIEKQLHGYSYPSLPRRPVEWTEKRIEAMARKSIGLSYSEAGRQNGITAQRVYFLFAKRAHGLQAGTWRGI